MRSPSRIDRVRPPRRGGPALALAALVAALALAAPLSDAAPPVRSNARAPVHPAVLPGTLQIGAFVAHPYDGFWAVVLSARTLLNHTLAALFNATPFVLIRYGSDDDATNISANCTYTNYGTCGRINESIPQFKIFCGWVHCLSVLGVPGEPNNAGLDAVTVRYVEQTLGFDPTFWSIGNEPVSWTHFNEPFADWRPTDHSTPDGVQYGTMVANATRAMLSVDPAARIIGDQDAQTGATASYLSNVSADAHGSVAAVAFHSYPGHYGPANPTVAQYLSVGNVTRTIGFLTEDRNSYRAGCGCATSVMVGEFNGAEGGSFSPEMAGYPDVPMVAAVAAQLLTANASAFTFFAFWGDQAYDLVNQSRVAESPTYTFLAEVARFLPMGGTYATSVNTTVAGVYAVEETDNASGAGVLIVNTNTTTAVNVSLPGWFGNGSAAVVSDAPGGLGNVTFANGTAPANWTVAPEGVALLLRGAAADLNAPAPSKPGGGGGSSGGSGGGSGGSGSASLSLPPYLLPLLVIVVVGVLIAVYVLFLRTPKRPS